MVEWAAIGHSVSRFKEDDADGNYQAWDTDRDPLLGRRFSCDLDTLLKSM
jgi:hypothetical protein